MLKKTFRPIRYAIEAFFCYLLYYLFSLMPIDTSSNLAGFIARKIGPYLKPSRVAYDNLSRCFPDMTELEKKQIITGMWENLGRIVGELPYWAAMSREEFYKRVKLIDNTGLIQKKKTMFVAAHLGNFELYARISKELNLNAYFIYRPANNKWVNRLINNQRLACGVRLIDKGVSGVRQIYKALKEDENIAMLVDQKTNDGELIDFIGIPAKTTTLPAKLALKFGANISIARIKREAGANYTVEIGKFIEIDKNDDHLSITRKINLKFEEWIRETPEQWFWVHKRWG